MQPRIYTYKITFEEVPYYYYGSKKEKYFDQPYMGSPVTHKWMWNFYTPQKQILELFDYTDKGYEKCLKVENRLIKPFLNDPWCLNSHCGGIISLDVKRKNGKNAYLMKNGIHSFTSEQKSKISKLLWDQGNGLASLTPQERKYNASLGGSANTEKQYNSRQKVGKKMVEEKRGLFSLEVNKLSENGKKGAKNTNLQRWKCTITGYISTSGGLSRYQKSRKIDTINRIKLN